MRGEQCCNCLWYYITFPQTNIQLHSLAGFRSMLLVMKTFKVDFRAKINSHKCVDCGPFKCFIIAQWKIWKAEASDRTYAFCITYIAVQSERKPIDLPREKPANCAASTEKIYIRKDLRSPLIATPTFISEKDATRWDSHSQTICMLHHAYTYLRPKV